MTVAVPETDALVGHLRRAMADLSQLDGLSMSIGGLVTHRSQMVLSELHKLRHGLLRGAMVRPGIGLGGLALQRRAPVAVQDYVISSEITHQFDHAVRADQIRSALAVPVIVKGEIRAVVYGATRQVVVVGERTLSTATVIAKRLAHEIEVEETVRTRLRLLREERSERPGPSLRTVADVSAELIAIAAGPVDIELRDRLLGLSRRLTGEVAAHARRAAVQLSNREAEVLAQLAAGYTNSEIAERLCILPTTVKTHVKSTMRKLGARNRVETVAAARHAGLLP